MKKRLPRRLALCLSAALALSSLALVGAFAPRSAEAQDDLSYPLTTPFYRFKVSNSNKGHYLTAIFSNGANLNYTSEGDIDTPRARGNVFPGVFLPTPPGYRLADNQPPYVPLHQWRVVEGGRTYYYYSPFLSTTHGSNYYYESVAGYVLPFNYDPSFNPNDPNRIRVTGIPVHYYYSVDYGYWYTTVRADLPFGPCYPDGCSNSSYVYQGVGFQLPANNVPNHPFSGCTNTDPVFQNCPVIHFVRDAPPPPPACDPDQEQSCWDSGGSWNSLGCSCSYGPPPEPTPCPQWMICGGESAPKNNVERRDEAPPSPPPSE